MQDLQGQTWKSPVSDATAAALLRLNPNVEQASLTDPDLATAQTVRKMVRLIRHSLSDPIVFAAAKDAIARFGNQGHGPAWSVWWWAKYNVKFVHHQKLLQQWLNKGDALQLLISPEALLKMEHPKGDCAVFTCLICAMLETLGVPWEIVVVAVDPRQPGIYSHVYPRVASGDHMALDASHGKFPGWHVPDQRVSRIQVFDQNGNPTEDAAPKFNGLHGVPMGCCAAYKGLGAAGDFTIDTTDLMAAAAEPTQFLSGDPGASVALSTPSAWDTTLAGLANQWTGIASRILAPTTTVMNPKTGLVIQTPASSTAAASLLTGATTTATTSSTLILYGVIVVGAILMFSLIKK